MAQATFNQIQLNHIFYFCVTVYFPLELDPAIRQRCSELHCRPCSLSKQFCINSGNLCN